MTYETIIQKGTGTEYEVLCDKSGENPQPCPACSHDRKKKNAKSFSYNAQTGLGHCNHCGGAFYKKNENETKWVRPLWENKTTLSDKVVEWFLKRNINQETLSLMKVTDGVEWMPHSQKEMNVIRFNYFRNGQLINTKSRSGDKGFKLVKDAEKIFYNIDGIKNAKDAYIVEGEIDCLTMIQAGYSNTVSVPNGATKGNNNLSYLDSCWTYFENLEKIYIATDTDEAGENLSKELARRLGVEKCYRITFGEFKDVNEQLCKTGRIDLSVCKPFPIEGVFGIEDHWESLLSLIKNGFPKGWKPRGAVGNHISFFPGYSTTITGIPGHGKSEWLDQVLMQISLDYDLRGGYFTPENWPTEIHVLKLVEKLIGKSAFKANELELKKAKSFLDNRIFWIYPDEGYDLDNILGKVRQAVLKHGIQWYVIDPWNKLEHKDDSTNYISRCLDLISNFNKKNGTHSFVVAHPTKMRMNQETGKYDVPGLYDISGSANFYNKTDLGVCVYKEEQGRTSINIQKVKFKFWGEIGRVEQSWDSINGRYSDFGSDPTNWLNIKPLSTIIDFTQPKELSDEVPF